MILNLLWVLTAFPFILAALGFFLKLSGTIEDETVFYLISGILLALLSIITLTSGIQYETGHNTTVTGVGSTTTYNYLSVDGFSLPIISLSLLAISMFFIIATAKIKKKRQKEETDEYGKSSW
jgi:NADH:ubiquinone oxidoreductase subunit 4 (subunit M)